MHIRYSASLLLAMSGFTHAVDYCPPLGPVYPKLKSLASVPAIRAAAENLTEHLLNILESPGSGFDTNTTSFSINLFSASESPSIFEYHRTAPSLNASGPGGTSKVDADSVYRIGSITKVFTALELLLHDQIRMDDSITKYIPELATIANEQGDSAEGEADEVADPIWSQITVGSLAGFLAGIGRDYTSGDITTYPYPWTQLGFPAVNTSTGVPTCGRDDKQPPCSRKDFLTNFPHRHPAYASYTTPVYSNAGFWILGYVVEAATSMLYADTLHADVLGPLNMTRTSTTKPNSAMGVIPVGDSGWDYELGGEVAAGGLYSSTNDLTRFCRAILDPPPSFKLSPVAARRWLKPVAHTSSFTYSVGAPWEIYRSTNLTTDGRIVDLYTKAGGLGEYASYIILLPDYDVGMAVLAAGTNTPLDLLAELVLQTFVPLIDNAGKVSAYNKYEGIYRSRGNITSPNLVNLTTDTGPGLKVNTWLSAGKDLLAEYNSFFGTPGGQIDMRLYPTGLTSLSSSNTQESFRAALMSPTSQGTDLLGGCSSWYGIDGFVYAGRAIDDFVFQLGNHSEVVSIEPRVMRQALPKIDRASAGLTEQEMNTRYT